MTLRTTFPDEASAPRRAAEPPATPEAYYLAALLAQRDATGARELVLFRRVAIWRRSARRRAAAA